MIPLIILMDDCDDTVPLNPTLVSLKLQLYWNKLITDDELSLVPWTTEVPSRYLSLTLPLYWNCNETGPRKRVLGWTNLDTFNDDCNVLVTVSQIIARRLINQDTTYIFSTYCCQWGLCWGSRHWPRSGNCLRWLANHRWVFHRGAIDWSSSWDRKSRSWWSSGRSLQECFPPH